MGGYPFGAAFGGFAEMPLDVFGMNVFCHML
jgi:hypothetical protein